MSTNLAIEQWGSPEAALGQRVLPDPNGSWREVIGVVEDVREDGVHIRRRRSVLAVARGKLHRASTVRRAARRVVLRCEAREPAALRWSMRSGSACRRSTAVCQCRSCFTMQDATTRR